MYVHKHGDILRSDPAMYEDSSEYQTKSDFVSGYWNFRETNMTKCGSVLWLLTLISSRQQVDLADTLI